MDDPWGSPWADEAAESLPKIVQSTRKEPVTPAKPLALNEKSNSPWDDNDGFGDWAAVPAIVDSNNNGTSGLGVVPARQWIAVPDSDSTPDEIDDSGDTPQDLFVEVPQSANSANLGSAIQRSDVRHISLGPWSRDEPQAAVADVCQVKDVSATGVESASVPPPKADIPIQSGSQGSRPSSSPSDRSPHEELFPDSPRTSFDDEERRPYLERKWPLPAKEILLGSESTFGDASNDDLEDGRRKIILQGNAEKPISEVAEDDFGDFEDFPHEPEEPPSGTTKDFNKAEEYPTKEAAMGKPDKVSTATKFPESRDVSASKEDSGVGSNERPIEALGQVKFDVDMSLVSRVFMRSLAIPEAENGEFPDLENIIQDSFSSMERRKTWYRISRYGTMRKHNAGDEDNYVRVSWKDSQVRCETLKIVARWIEERRMGGGFTLGGGISSGTLFGWGQRDAAPVSVAAVLANKSGNTASSSDASTFQTAASSSASCRISGQALKRHSIEHASSSKSPTQSPSSIVAPQFSWSTVSPVSSIFDTGHMKVSPPTKLINASQPIGNVLTSQEMPEFAPLTVKSPEGHVRNSTLAPSSQPMSANNVPSFSVKDPSIPLYSATTSRDLGAAEDDEWGEMVTTPSTDAPPQMSSSRELGTRPKGLMELLKPASTSILPAAGVSNHDINRMSYQPDKFGATPATSSTTDVWSSTDFSFFDTSSPPIPVPLHSLPINNTKPPPPAITNSQRAFSEENNQDRIVKTIVKNLPDLSYMLRR